MVDVIRDVISLIPSCLWKGSGSDGDPRSCEEGTLPTATPSPPQTPAL